MFVLRLCLLLVFAVFAAVETTTPTTTTPTTTTTTTTTTSSTNEPDSLCNCNDHCPESRVIGLEKNGTAKNKTNELLEEDTDEDGDLQICARSRDSDDRTFPSVCHMMCYNNCTKYRVYKALGEDGQEVKFVAAYQENYYKLRDGAC